MAKILYIEDNDDNGYKTGRVKVFAQLGPRRG